MIFLQGNSGCEAQERGNAVNPLHKCRTNLKKGGEIMRINKQKLQIAMANICITSNELQKKSELPRGTFLNVITGKNVRPATAGKIAKALNIPVENLIDMESDD